MVLLSVYSPFSDRVGLPLHNINSPFPSVMDIFFAISASTLPNTVLGLPTGLPTGLLASTHSIHFFTQSSSHVHNHLSLRLMMTVVIGSTPIGHFNSSLVLLSHIYLIICISALSNFNLTLPSKGLVSLP